MAASANRMKLKNTPMDTWSTRERLCLGSSVMRSGDQNWVSVSRAIKPFGENNRPADWFSQKNCARQYADLLEKVETPKRKRGERGEIETPGESIVRKLTLERIEELKMIIQQEQQQYHKIRTEIDIIQSGQCDDKLEELWKQVLEEKKKEDQAIYDHQKWLQDRELAKAAMLTVPKTNKVPVIPIAKQKKNVKHPRTGVMRRSSSQSEPGSEAESTSNSPPPGALNVDVDIPSIAPKPPQPTSPLLTSLLKSPTAASGFSILHSAITQPKEGGRMVPTTSTSAISTLLSSSPCKSGLLASAFNLDPEIPTRPPTTSPSAGAPTLSRLLEMPLASPGKPLPPLPVVTPEAEQSPPIEATPDSSTDTICRPEEPAVQEQTEVSSTCIPSTSTLVVEENVACDPSDNVGTEVTVMEEPEQISVVLESVVVIDSSTAEADRTVKEESISDIVDVSTEAASEHIPDDAISSLMDLKLGETEEVVIEETGFVEIKEEPVAAPCPEIEVKDEDFQVVQEELVEADGEEEAVTAKVDSIKEEEVEEDSTLLHAAEELVEVKSEEADTSITSLDETPKPASPTLKEEPEPESEPEVRSDTPSSIKEQPTSSRSSESTRGTRGRRGRGGRRSFPPRTLHHSGSNDSKPKDSPKPSTDDSTDEENEDESSKRALEVGKTREKITKGKDDTEAKDRDEKKSAKKDDGRAMRRDEGKNRKDDGRGKKTSEGKDEGKGRKSEGKDDAKGRKSEGKDDGKGRKSEGKDDGKGKKGESKTDSRGKKSEGKEDGRRRKSDGKEDGRGRKAEGRDDAKGKKGEGKEDGKGKKIEGKEATDDERSRSRKRSTKEDDAKDSKVSKKEETSKEKKIDGRRRKTLTAPLETCATPVETSVTSDSSSSKLPSKLIEEKEDKQIASSDNDDSPEPETPKKSRRGKERDVEREREDSFADTDDDKFSERDESSNLSKSLFPSDSVPNSPASNAQSDDHEGLRDYKVWKKAIMLVWRSAATHKFANVFLHPVTEEVAPGYKVVVYRPMDLSQIKKNIENGVIKTTAEFQRDMMLMFQNAIMYNSSDHDVYAMAVEMQKEVMCHIQDFLATQLMVQTAEIPKSLRRETRELAQKRTSESFSDLKQMDDAKRSGSESEGSKPKKRRMRTADD